MEKYHIMQNRLTSQITLKRQMAIYLSIISVGLVFCHKEVKYIEMTLSFI